MEHSKHLNLTIITVNIDTQHFGADTQTHTHTQYAAVAVLEVECNRQIGWSAAYTGF